MKSEVLEHINICNCSRFAHSKLFYNLKKCFLEKYGQFVGYSIQRFEKKHWNWFYEGDRWDDEYFYTDHEHILMDYAFLNQIFHIPTNEFAYSNPYSNIYKKSKDFDVLESYVTTELEGTKSKSTNKEAFESLKWLIKWYRTQEQSQLKLSL